MKASRNKKKQTSKSLTISEHRLGVIEKTSTLATKWSSIFIYDICALRYI